jgi:hypothetical protein
VLAGDNAAVQAHRTVTARVLVVLLSVSGSSAGLAMSMRESKTPLTSSADGATLYEVQGEGPEGGGSLSYRVQGRSPRDTIDFLVSSDLSPGDGSRPQSVSTEVCRQRLAALTTELAKRKIAGVTVRPEGCRTVHRVGLVAVAKPAQ